MMMDIKVYEVSTLLLSLLMHGYLISEWRCSFLSSLCYDYASRFVLICLNKLIWATWLEVIFLFLSQIQIQAITIPFSSVGVQAFCLRLSFMAIGCCLMKWILLPSPFSKVWTVFWITGTFLFIHREIESTIERAFIFQKSTKSSSVLPHSRSLLLKYIGAVL